MGVEIKPSAKRLPASTVFMDFLHRYLQEMLVRELVAGPAECSTGDTVDRL
jgi:hypothetical protein